MSQRFCPNCGAPLQFSDQKFCTSCGVTLPEPTPAGAAPAAPAGAGLPVTALAAGAVIVFILLAAGALFILPDLAKDAGASSAEAGGSSDGASLPGTPAMTPAEDRATDPVTTKWTTALASPLTTPPTTAPASQPTTPLTPSPTTPIPTPTATTTAPTPVPEPEETTMITASVTRVPEQPPSSSYTSSTPGAPYVDPGALEARVHELVNLQRQNNGLAPLSYDPFLADIARGHSWDMVQQGYFEHVNPAGLNARGRGDWAGYPCVRVFGLTTYSGISENLYQGNRAESYFTNAEGEITSYNWRTPEDIAQVCVNGWMASPGHRENIVTPHFSYEGIGVAFSPDDEVYITQNFC